jgi:hypothetical protein
MGFEKYILWSVETLLCNEPEIKKFTRAVSRQRLGKHFPAATNTHATIEVFMEYNNRDGILVHGPR